MKKLISFILSILIILNTFGFNLILIFMIQESRTENLEIIDEHPETISSMNIITFSLKFDNPEFINSREIRYDNEMYDVIYKKETKEDTYFYCVIDKKESKLHLVFRSLNEISDNPVSIPDHVAITILKNLLKNYLPGTENAYAGNYNSLRFFTADILSVRSVIPERIYPPPRIQTINC